MCVCAYVYVYVHVHVHAHVHVYAYVCIYTYIYIMNICLVNTKMNNYILILMYTCTGTDKRMCMYAYIYICIYTSLYVSLYAAYLQHVSQSQNRYFAAFTERSICSFSRAPLAVFCNVGSTAAVF